MKEFVRLQGLDPSSAARGWALPERALLAPANMCRVSYQVTRLPSTRHPACSSRMQPRRVFCTHPACGCPDQCAAGLARRPQAEVPLLTPDILVCSVGTEILIKGGLEGCAWCSGLSKAQACSGRAATLGCVPHVQLPCAQCGRPARARDVAHGRQVGASHPFQALPRLATPRAQASRTLSGRRT